MKYRMRKKEANEVRSRIKSKYFTNTLGFTKSYLSLVFTSKRDIPKSTAFAFAKAIDVNSNIEDYFDEV